MGKVFRGLVISALGATVAAGAAAIAGAAYGLRKWAKDEDAEDIKLVFGGPNGIRISKTEDKGRFTVDTKYDWQNDPEFCDCEDDECCCTCEDETEDECCCTCEDETASEPVKAEEPAEAPEETETEE